MATTLKKFILGEKVNMTQIFDADGTVFPVTVVKTSPLTVTQLKAKTGKDGYEAVQVAFGTKSAKNQNQASKGHLKSLGNFKKLQEIKIEGTFEIGQTIGIDAFTEGEKVVVSSISKGKGFQGVVKRHGFAGGPRTHGQKHSEREPGSISGNTRNGGRVPKGMRMAGRMGGDRITQKNMKIVQIDAEAGLIMIEGAIAGRRGTLVEIKA